MVRWLDLVALGIFTFELTDSPSQVALVFFFRMLPRLLFSIPIGTIVDRVDRQRLLFAVQSTQAIVAAGLATVVLTDVVAYWQVIIYAMGSGTLWTAEFSPATGAHRGRGGAAPDRSRRRHRLDDGFGGADLRTGAGRRAGGGTRCGGRPTSPRAAFSCSPRS